MFTAILPILINIFLLSRVETIPIINEANCWVSMLGCNCQNIEIVTIESVEPCCNKSDQRTLIITGSKVKNISINISNSQCSKNFEILFIQETGIVSFDMPFHGLGNINKVYIEKNQNLSSFNKLHFSEISQKIDSISVESNAIRTIAVRTFANLPNLTSLKLADNKIGYIDDRSFANLTKLSTLNLNNNILTILGADMFYGLEHLKSLTVLNNLLMDLKPDVFKHVTNLQFLSLSFNPNLELQDVPRQSGSFPDNVFFSVKKLKFLRMVLKIKNLTPLSFYGLKELQTLNLTSNQLSVIASGTLQQVPKVTSIYLSRNVLRCLQADTFHSLPRLINLDLSYNELSYISNDVFADLTNLQTLDLAENNIYVIEKNAFIGLRSLMVFKINVIHGKAKNELQNNFPASPFAKLRNSTKILGLSDFFGISSGSGEPPEVYATAKPASKESEVKKIPCPIATVSDKDWIDSSNTGSRKYLLIIVGICVIFLLVAFAIIMSYRAWSKRKMSELSYNVDIQEKQEMLVNNSNSVNGRIDVNKPHSKSNHARKSLNGSYTPDSPVEIIETKTDSFVASQAQQSSAAQSVKPVSCPLSNECNHSDDESALTPLGVL